MREVCNHASILVKMSVNKEDCSVCLNITCYTTKCGHYLCEDCAKILLEMQNLDEKIGCPICRKTLRESLFDSYNPYARHIETRS